MSAPQDSPSAVTEPQVAILPFHQYLRPYLPISVLSGIPPTHGELEDGLITYRFWTMMNYQEKVTPQNRKVLQQSAGHGGPWGHSTAVFFGL